MLRVENSKLLNLEKPEPDYANAANFSRGYIINGTYLSTTQ